MIACPGWTGWRAALATPAIPAAPEQIRAWLAGLADAATIRYLEYGRGNPVMLEHADQIRGLSYEARKISDKL